jgi:hypothetical protein
MVALISGRAQTTVSYTNSIPATLTDWETTLGLAQFNPALGQLVSFDISLYSALNTALWVSNDLSSASASSGYSQAEMFITFGDGAAFPTNQPALVYYSSAFNYTNLPPGQVVSQAENGNGFVRSSPVTDPSLLARYTGNGTVVQNVIANAFAGTIFSGGNSTAVQNTMADIQAVITYTYNAPVPEPGEAALLTIGALVGLFRWSRSSRFGKA